MVDIDSNSSAPSIRAAQYVRMSTEHQKYSTENQADIIAVYAAARGMEIVRTYADEGKSGLNLSGREGLQRLISDVTDGRADFAVILVYDISRWGRFQDADQSAYYETICKQAGVTVHYCAEQFENDGSMSSSVLKTLKRSMAAEYSRELSVKVFSGQCRLIELGFRQGGPAATRAEMGDRRSRLRLRSTAGTMGFVRKYRCGNSRRKSACGWRTRLKLPPQLRGPMTL